jgi:hypothetical protein
MELEGIIKALAQFYVDKFGQLPHEITMGRYWYGVAREQGIVEMPPSWKAGDGWIHGLKIDVDIRDDYKLAIEDYRRYQAGHYRMRD